MDILSALKGFFTKPGGANLQGAIAGEEPQSGFENLLNNPMFLQYLSGAGAGLAKGGGAGMASNMNDITQNTIATQSYAKMLQRVLGGDMSGGAKVSMDENGLSIKVPNAQQSGQSTSAQPTQMDSPQPSKLENLQSPFASGLPNMSASDLAGLTPDMLSQMLQFKFARDKMVADYGEDQFNRLYKKKLMEQMDSQVAENKAQIEIANREATRKMYETLTKDQRTDLKKNYDYAKEEGYTGTILDFKNSGGTPNSYEEYQLAKKEGYKGKYLEFIERVGKSRASNVTISPYDRAIQTGKAESINEVTSPLFVDKVKKLLGSDPSRTRPDLVDSLVNQGKSEEEAIGLVNNAILKDSIEKALIQSYMNSGKQVVRGTDGWYVDGERIREFPNGY